MERSFQELCQEAAHTAPKRASSLPDIFTSSFAGFQDVGFICGLEGGEKANCGAIFIIVSSPLKRLCPFLRPHAPSCWGHSHPGSFALSYSDAPESRP